MRKVSGPYRWGIAAALVALLGAAVSASILKGNTTVSEEAPKAPAGYSCCPASE